jgi:hypothetical protein
VAGVVEGRLRPTPLEAALVDLARKSCEAPARLGPDDLVALRALAGDGALEYALVLGAFHFVNRIADLLGVDPELPGMPWLRRAEALRRLAVRAMTMVLGRMDLALRPFDRTFADVVASLPPAVDRTALEALRPRPHVLEAIRLAREERGRSSLDPATLVAVDAAVEAALPASAEGVEGFHARPADPVGAFAFVGTRYAQRATAAMIDALRRAGWDDLRLLDLAIAVADANQWARLRRLLALPASLGPTSAA